MKKIFTILGIAAAMFANAQNLLTNPGFENDLTGWTKGPTASYTEPSISTTEFHSGAKSAAYIGASATTGFYQNVPVTAGQTYVISFWYKATGDGTDARIWSLYKDALGAPVYTTGSATDDPFRNNNGYLDASSEWKQHVAEMPAGPGAVSLDVAVRVYSSGTGYFDDFVAMDKANLSVTDVNVFDKAVKMNTVVENELKLTLPERATVNIYSMDGKLVSSNRVSNGGAVDTSYMTKGNYIVTVDNGSAKVSRKIIKK